MEYYWLEMVQAKLLQDGELPDQVRQDVVEMINFSERTMFTHCADNNCTVSTRLTHIWNYGCWCNFGTNLMTGRGPPKNGFDQICKNFQQCLRCAKLDGRTVPHQD